MGYVSWKNQPIWKICSSNWVHLPQIIRGENVTHILETITPKKVFVCHVGSSQHFFQRSIPWLEDTGELITWQHLGSLFFGCVFLRLCTFFTRRELMDEVTRIRPNCFSSTKRLAMPWNVTSVFWASWADQWPMDVLSTPPKKASMSSRRKHGRIMHCSET